MTRLWSFLWAGIPKKPNLPPSPPHLQAPAWAFIMSALGLFIYQSLDAIDGKQARRTNTSSALGELFDHGCDAVSTGTALLTGHLNPSYYSFCFLQSIKNPLQCIIRSERDIHYLFCLSSFSLRCCGNMHFVRNRKTPRLDFLLRFYRDVHVLLRPLADLRVRDPPLWLVSYTFSSVQ